MIEKLLCIKKDNNIILYKVSYQQKFIKDLIESLKTRYSYTKNEKIETTVYKDKPLSMGIFDELEYVKISDEYEILEAELIDKNTKKVKIKTEVSYDSVFGDILEETFLSNEPILDLTKLYKIINSVYRRKNNFQYSEYIDFKNVKNKWNNPGRLVLSEKDKIKSINYKNEALNADNIKLNANEKNNMFAINMEIKDELNSLFHYEQVGMFPIQENPDKLFKIFEEFGKRNEEYENYIKLDHKCRFNMDGGQYIRSISDEVLEAYKPQKKLYEKDADYIEFIKSKLKIA